METKLLHFIDNITAYVASVPAHSWYVLGITLASIPVVIGITEWVKARHFKVKASELANHFIALNVVLWSTLMASADFIVTQGNTWGVFLPFLHTQLPTLIAGASTVYAFAKGLHSWFVNRQNEEQKQRLGAVLSAADSAIASKPTESFGTVATAPVAPEEAPQPTVLSM